MFDTMTMTKIVGGLCGALLIFLMGNWVAETLYSMDSGHGGEEHAMGYHIETEGDDGDAEEEAEEEVDFAALLAEADADKGAKVFGKCKACHSLEEGKNGSGPSFYGLIGRDIGSAEGFGYTEILTELEGDWTPEALSDFLADPKAYAPGTKMNVKVPKIGDRANLIAYLSTIGG